MLNKPIEKKKNKKDKSITYKPKVLYNYYQLYLCV